MDEKYQQKDLKTEAEFNTKVKQLTEQYKQEMEKLMDITHHLAVKDDDLSKHHTTLKNAKREELQAITKGFYKQTDIVNFLEVICASVYSEIITHYQNIQAATTCMLMLFIIIIYLID